jgi:hypothetical protein
VILVVLFGGRPRVLMDGLITNQQFSPGSNPGTATLTLTGEDVSIAMDMEKKRSEYVGRDETMIAMQIIESYAQYQLVPDITPPPVLDVPLPIERTPTQQHTDLDQLKRMAQRFGYVFYVTPGPFPGMNTAHWGPPQRISLPQRALTVSQGPEQNVDQISFAYNGLAATAVKDVVQDRLTNMTLPVLAFFSTRVPPLAAMPALPFQFPNVRMSLLDKSAGLSWAEAQSRAQGVSNKSIDSVVTAQGELDALRYGDLLEARGIVGLRGAGFTYDGLYYVKSVSHAISKGQYKQRFNLTREGTGAITPVVVP